MREKIPETEMVIVNIKPFDEILSFAGDNRNILILGCAGCAAVCLGGGQREVDELMRKIINWNSKCSVKGFTIERQCDPKFLQSCDILAKEADVILSMGCGAGTQMIADRYNIIPVHPVVNTVFIGINKATGVYEERCRSCGDCHLSYTAGICPVTSCAKSLLNGPCGGPKNGQCEVGRNLPCAWCLIYERLKLQNRLQEILITRKPVRWHNGIREVVIQPEYKSLYNNMLDDK